MTRPLVDRTYVFLKLNKNHAYYVVITHFRRDMEDSRTSNKGTSEWRIW